MRRKHYAIGAAVLTVGAAALVLLPKLHNEAGLGGVAYLPSDVLSVFNAPAIEVPVAEIDIPAIDAPKATAPVVVAEMPTSAPIDAPMVVARADTGKQLPEIPAASAPSEQPFVWHGSGGGGQSWKGTGGRVAGLNNGPSAPSGGSAGGGGGSSGGSNLPDVFTQPPSLPPVTRAPSNAPKSSSGFANNGSTPSGVVTQLADAPVGGLTGSGGPGLTQSGGTSNTIVDNGSLAGNGGLMGGSRYASYEKPAGEQIVVTVDEPASLALLLVGTLGLFAARRVGKRTIA